MTDLPPVVCHACGASYRHPGRAGRTKCKSCGATLVVTMPAEAEAAAPPVVAPKAPEAAPRPTVQPAGGKPKPVPPTVKPSRPQPPVVAPQASAEAAPEPEAEAAPANRGTVSRERQRPGARAKRPTTGGSSRRKQQGAEQAQERKQQPRRGSRGASRRGRSTSGRPTTVVIPESEIPVPKKGPSTGLLIGCGIGAVVLLGGILWFALSGPGDDDKGNNTGTNDKTASKENTGGTKKAAAPDLTDALVGGGDPASENPGDAGTPSETPPAEAGTKETETKKPVKKKPAKKPVNKYERRWNDLPKFEVVAGTHPDQESQIKGLITEALDPNGGAASYRAQDKIIAFGKNAIPLIMNEYLTVDVDGTQAEILRGQVLNELLKEITKITDRYYDPTESGQEAGYYRSLVRRYWHSWWKKNQTTWTGPKVEDEEEDG